MVKKLLLVIIRQFATLFLADLVTKEAGKYETVPELKEHLKAEVQRQKKVPGTIRRIICRYIDGVRGLSPEDVIETILDDLGANKLVEA